MWIRGKVLHIALLISLGACSSATEPHPSAAGAYRLVRVNASLMPYTYLSTYPGVGHVTITGWSILLNADGSASFDRTEEFIDPPLIHGHDFGGGGWRDSANVVVLAVDPEGIARLIGDTLRVSALDGYTYDFSR
jgi:hypothetical protein